MRTPGTWAVALSLTVATSVGRAGDSPWNGVPTPGVTWARAQQTPLPAAPPRVEVEPAPLPTRPRVEIEPSPPATKPAPIPAPALLPTPTQPPSVYTQPAAPAPPSVWDLQPLSGGVSLSPKRGTRQASPTITMDRDYSVLDLFGAGRFGDDANTHLLGAAVVPNRSYVRAEYLLWWVRGGDIPVLATTATGGGFGFLGTPGTQPLLGPGHFGNTARQGVRVRAGTLLGDAGLAGIDAGFFYLGQRTTDYHVDSGSAPTIARPFYAPNYRREFAELVAYPGIATGALDVRLTSTLWGADVNTRCLFCNTCDTRSEAFAGYRHLNLREALSVTENATAGPRSTEPAGTQVVVRDSFRTANQFHGGQVGYAFGRNYGAFDFDARLSVALGVTHQELQIDGSQSRTRPGEGTQFFTGGLLATGPNLGRVSRNRFSVAPEATLNLGLRLTDNWKVYTGYNFLAWTNVLRPGDQIDRTVDVSNVPNWQAVSPAANRPLPTLTESNLWAQGVQFGVEYRW
jgi:hypothetical protein